MPCYTTPPSISNLRFPLGFPVLQDPEPLYLKVAIHCSIPEPLSISPSIPIPQDQAQVSSLTRVLSIDTFPDRLLQLYFQMEFTHPPIPFFTTTISSSSSPSLCLFKKAHNFQIHLHLSNQIKLCFPGFSRSTYIFPKPIHLPHQNATQAQHPPQGSNIQNDWGFRLTPNISQFICANKISLDHFWRM